MHLSLRHNPGLGFYGGGGGEEEGEQMYGSADLHLTLKKNKDY